MIIVRSPLRISLGGGGTDLPWYYEKHGGSVLAAAINKYVYINISRPFSPGILLKYSDIEQVNFTYEVKHPIFKEALRIFEQNEIEITSVADIPSGTGLGSSGSFTTALLKGLFTYAGQPSLPGEIARLACEIEIDLLHEPIGKQDQYIASYGGITQFNFDRSGEVSIIRPKISSDTISELEDNLLLFFTGIRRDTREVLKCPASETDVTLSKLHGETIARALQKGCLEVFAETMSEHWTQKRKHPGMSNADIDAWYEIGMENGAIGGKLVGAGGGGFLLFYAEDSRKLRKAMASAGLREVRFSFDFEGTKVILS